MVSTSEEWYKDQTSTDAIVEPKEGMVFGSPDEAFGFYKLYAKKKGFGVMRRTSHNFYGIKYDVTFSCNKNRKPPECSKEGFL